MTEIKLGKYQHYKGGFYEVIGLAKHSETLETMVVYRALYDLPKFGANALWVRPTKSFYEKVLVNGTEVPRYKLIDLN